MKTKRGSHHIAAVAATLLFIFAGTPQQGHAETQMYFVHTDHLGTPEVMTDKDQNVVWRADSKPFGETDVHGTINENARFPGQFFDDESELAYNYHRYYDPSIGRYITSDPIGLGGGLNTYGYVGGNPGRFFDPYGLAAGDYPPAPPGYNPDTWDHGKWPNGKDYVTDPEGNNWTVHPEDGGHWPHWDVAPPNGKPQQNPWNAGKLRPGQKKPKKGQNPTNPNDPDEPAYCPPDDCPQEMMPVVEGAAVVGGSLIGGYIVWKFVKVCLCTWIATPIGGVACAVTP